MRHELIPKGLKRMLVGSAAVHSIAIVAMLTLGDLRGSSASVPPENFIVTKLVRLGKKRPKKFLPLADRPPPPPEKPAVNIAPPQDAPPTEVKPQPAKSASDRIKELSRVQSAIDRLKTSNRTPEGDPSGVVDGEISDVSKAIAGNKFATELDKCIRRGYVIEGVDRAKVRNRKASVLVRVDASGRIIESSIIESSKLRAFDRAVLRAVKSCGKVSPPPEILRDEVRKIGIELVFKP